MRTHLLYAATLCFTICIPCLANGNLVFNGDFEAGNIGFETELVFAPAGNCTPESTYAIVTDPYLFCPAGFSFGDHTTGSGLMMAAVNHYEIDIQSL